MAWPFKTLLTYSSPIKTPSHSLQLRLHFAYILFGPLGWINPTFNSRILCWQAKCIPCHRVKNIVSLHSIESGQNVWNCVNSKMAHVKVSRRIGKHWKHKHLALPLLLLAGMVLRRLSPSSLPFCVNWLKIKPSGRVSGCASSCDVVRR